MSSKHDFSPEAVELRKASAQLEWWGAEEKEHPENLSKDDMKRWRKLSRAAVAYAKLVLAGQCIPKEKP